MKRYSPESGDMEPDSLGSWVRIEDATNRLPELEADKRHQENRIQGLVEMAFKEGRRSALDEVLALPRVRLGIEGALIDPESVEKLREATDEQG